MKESEHPLISLAGEIGKSVAYCLLIGLGVLAIGAVVAAVGWGAIWLLTRVWN